MNKKIAGRIVTTEETFLGTIYFNPNTGLITKINRAIEENALLYSLEDCVIFSGFGDIHVHSREDESQKHSYKEDFLSCSQSAINGGVTFFADMPNNPKPPIDDISYEKKKNLTNKAKTPIFLYAGIGKNTKPLKKKVPYKVYMSHSIGDLFFENQKDLERVLKNYQGENVSFHCEDPITLQEKKKELLHEKRRPPQAEVIATENALELIKKYSLEGKICHYSTASGLKKIIEAKKKKLNVTCEVSPIHLFFDTSILAKENQKYFQMNPPLRNLEDRQFLIKALKEGWIDYLATDHAPHTLKEKKEGISGISQIDSYALFVTHLIINEKVDLQIIARICSKNPGQFVNQFLEEKSIYGKGFGEIEENYAANFTILNLKKETLFSKQKVKSKCGWSIFENHTFPGDIEAVYVLGEKIR